MSSWGVNIYQNDVALDTKEMYVSYLRKGLSDAEAYESTLKDSADYLSTDDAVDFWLGLASIMYDYGRLTEDVKNKAITIITESNDLERWDPRHRKSRKLVLEKLMKKLNSPLPEYRLVKKAKKYTPSLNPNDVYYFRLECNNPCYVIILVDSWITFDLRVDGLGDQLPIIYLKVCRTIPSCVEDVDNIEFFDLDTSSWVNRDFGGDKRVLMHPEGFLKFKKKMVYIDNYDFRRDSSVNENRLIKSNEWKWKGKHGFWNSIENRINTIIKAYDTL